MSNDDSITDTPEYRDVLKGTSTTTTTLDLRGESMSSMLDDRCEAAYNHCAGTRLLFVDTSATRLVYPIPLVSSKMLIPYNDYEEWLWRVKGEILTKVDGMDRYIHSKPKVSDGE